MKRQTTLILLAAWLVTISYPAALAAPLIYTDVAPILLGRCVMCHVPGGLMGDPPEGFRIDTYETMLSTSDRARIVPGNALASELYRRIAGYARPRMPFNAAPLSNEEIDKIGQWINEGARDASGNPAPSIFGAAVRLHGKLSARWQLDGLPLSIHADTRIKKSPAIGGYVEVRGRVSGDGGIIVDRIRAR